ncbi:MAG: histidine phosphatase family protein [Anaerolineae bacterium]|nr:histidine phosphatase family protein [Anaerolineae bacterium]
MTQPTIIHLIRHGEVHNPQQVLYGRLPNFRLSDTGQRQAQAAAQFMRDRALAAIFSSPQQRTQETAGFVAGHHPDLQVRVDPRLDEIHSPYQGNPLNQLAAMGWDLYTNIAPEFEQPLDILRRTQEFVNQVRQDCAGSEVAAITHGDVIAFMFLFVKGVEPAAGKKVSFTSLGLPEIYPATASVSTLTYFTDAPDEVPEYSYKRPY